MARDNWKGTSGWKTISDPTGVLTGFVLVGTGGRDSFSEDTMITKEGTATGITITNYSAYLNYAFPSFLGSETFSSGSVGLVARASNYSSTAPLTTAQDCYIARLNQGTGLSEIIRRISGTEVILASAGIPSSAFTFGGLHTLEFKCTGDASTGIIMDLLVDGASAVNVGDSSSNKLTTGDAGIQVGNGTTYIDNFTMFEYSSSGSATADWTPLTLTASVVSLWLNASVGISLGTGGLSSTILGWNDQSGNSNNIIANPATNQHPTIVPNAVNALAAAEFDGDNDFVQAADSATLDMGVGGLSIFVIYNADDFGSQVGASTIYEAPMIEKGLSYQYMLSNDTAGTPTKVTSGYEYNNNSDFPQSTNSAANLGTWQIAEFITRGGSSALATQSGFFANGTQQGQIGATVKNGADNADNLVIGQDGSGGTLRFDGKIAEVVVCKGELSEANRQKMEGYFAWRYGLTGLLPADHPYKTLKPTV